MTKFYPVFYGEFPLKHYFVRYESMFVRCGLKISLENDIFARELVITLNLVRNIPHEIVFKIKY